MEAVRRLIPLALLIVSCLAELNSTESEGKSSCRANLGGISQTENHKALILQLNPKDNCTWTVESPENKSIRIIFSYLQLDPDGGCESENIEVFNGNSTKASLLGRVCSANDYVPVFESSSNTLTVQIVTDSARIPRSVFIFYYFFSSGTSIPDCGGYLHTLEGSFTSPNYPRPHPELAYCVWHIQVEKGYKIKLNFKEIFLEVDEHCRFDFVAVYDGSSTTSGLLGQVCGRVRPTFESSSDSLTVVLSTDYANSYRGFSASYTSIYAENVNTTSLTCFSDRMRAIISKSYLASLEYSENSLQLNNSTCRPRISNVVEFSIPLDGCGTIKKRCIQDETCEVYPLSEHYGRFQFNAFKFLRSLSSVYLQCKVLICNSGDHQSRCSRGCVSRGKRDISSYKWKTDSVIGPIRLKRDRSASGSSGFQDQIHGEETQNQPFNSLHLFSFMVLVLNVVVVAIVTVRHFVSQRTGYKYQKLKACNEGAQPQ
nr:CUB and zona pellucida-like domain-containing protein 1 [Manis javanica]